MAEKKSVRSRVQKFGSNLSSMIMPNIGAFIAWGIITAIAVPTGVAFLSDMIDPILYYLLPILIAFTGGRLVHGFRGGVVGATAVMGVIAAADQPMFIGAWLWVHLVVGLKSLMNLWKTAFQTGLKCLLITFLAGILGAVLAIFGSFVIGPVVTVFTNTLGAGVDAMISLGYCRLYPFLLNRQKFLFLNNAINFGVIAPVALEQVNVAGNQCYLVRSKPWTRSWILLAYMFFGKGAARASSYGAAVIHFFGGIHEIYFPYVLMKPLLIISAIFGGMSGIFVLGLFDAGLRAIPSPGSIISVFAMTNSTVLDYTGVALSVLAATTVSFLISAFILRFDKKGEEENLEEAQAKMQDMKGKKSSAIATVNNPEAGQNAYANVSTIIFACDAGMGSSAMGASIMKDRVKKAGVEDVSVSNTSISNIPDNADLVITHKDLTDRAKQKRPNAIHVSVDNFMNSPRYNEIIEELQSAKAEPTETEEHAKAENVEKIIFACDAGMGSSAMGASLLKDKFKKAGITGISVTNTAISSIPSDADIVITHKDLTDRAKQKLPNAEHISVENFMNSPRYQELIERLK
ncbi:LOW QUALITY PROTEIN: PTS system, mannitol-specific IIB component [Bacillus sp. JCM 19046]|nr:LOW QUALITY PROTEIN: PTS system, mannitol-specific IIB component [Bacillus sp. JCM 19046]